MFEVTQIAITKNKIWVSLFLVLAICVLKPFVSSSGMREHLKFSIAGDDAEALDADLWWPQETTGVRNEETASFIKTAGQLVSPIFWRICAFLLLLTKLRTPSVSSYIASARIKRNM